ncbi:G-protein coupled receptor family C group 6 member A-like, partial [Scleropages formosus]
MMQGSRYILALWAVVLLGGTSQGDPQLPLASAPGNIIIGALFPIHEGTEKTKLSPPQAPICERFSPGGTVMALALIHAVESMNRSPLLTRRGLSLGYRLHDSCSDVTTAVLTTQTFSSVALECGPALNGTRHHPAVTAVIGEMYSEVSIAVARLLNLQLIPQISYASTAVILSDKNRFPAFMRTVPNDDHQTRAMVKLLSDNGWTWVGVLTTDGEYGRHALDSFVSQASEKGICVAFQQVLPDLLSDLNIYRKITSAARTIAENPKVRVVVSFARPEHMKHFEVQGLSTESLLNTTNGGVIFSIQMAVTAIAHAVAELCTARDCSVPSSVQPWELLAALKKTRFEVEGKFYSFDSETGDINLGYNFVQWGPGQFKKTTEGQHTCCYECVNCTENHFSNKTDMDQCFSCGPHEWSPVGSSQCVAKTVMFFSWQDRFAMVLLVLALLGILLTLSVGVLFLCHRHTPVVKASGGPLSFLTLLGLTGSFSSAALFIGQPTRLQCQVRQVLFGLSFTLCVACILVKSLNILLAFQLNPALVSHLCRLYQPYAIISSCVGLQGLICGLWLALCSPTETMQLGETTTLAVCSEGSYEAFGTMLGYIALLALICFACAYKSRKLPQNYNEAKFITFSMLIYFISWVIFIPV